MDEQREWLKKMRKRRLRTLAVVLCFSVLAMNFPSILETLSVYAALPDEARSQTMVLGTAQAELAVPDALEEAVVGENGEESSEGDGTVEFGDGENGGGGDDNNSGGDDNNSGGDDDDNNNSGGDDNNSGGDDDDNNNNSGGGEDNNNSGGDDDDNNNNSGGGEDNNNSDDNNNSGGDDNNSGDGDNNDGGDNSGDDDNNGDDNDPGSGGDNNGGTTGNGTISGNDTKTKYTVTFYDGDMEMSDPAPQKVESGQSATEPAAPTKQGYTFKEWMTEKEGGEPFDFTKPITADTSVYASWTKNASSDPAVTPVKITYYENGGTLSAGTPTTHTPGTETALLAPEREGYTFDGWYTDEDFKGSVWTKIDADNGDDAFTFYAKWTGKKYLVTFDYQGATGGDTTPDIEVTYGSPYGPLPSPKKTNYAFGGWYTNLDDTYSKITALDVVEIANDHSLYALWMDEYDVATEFEITYILGEGGYSENPPYYTKETKTFTLRDPKRPGYTFTGWTGTDVPEITKKVTVEKGSFGNREYTAHWSRNSYTVKFNYNGATGGKTLSQKTVYFDSTYGILPEPVKNNYEFVNWYTDSECRGDTAVTGDTLVAIPKSHTLYAKWRNSDGTYTVTLKSDKGYTLKAQKESVSPVEENGSFTFVFKLEKDYQKSDSFAVLVNGKKVKLSSKDTYTIEEINENKTVTVEGVKSKDSDDETSESEGVWENQAGDDSSGNTTDNNSYPAPSAKRPDVKPSPSVVQAENSVESSAKQTAGTSSAKSSKTAGSLEKSVTTGKKLINSLRDRFSAIGSTFGTEPDIETDGENTENSGNDESGVRAGNEVVQSLHATVEDDRIVLPGDPVPAGNVAGMLGSVAGAEGAGTTLDLGDGSVTVKVMCKETDCRAGVADAAAVANAVLTSEQIQLAAAGENIEVRIDIKDISRTVTEQDREVIARCIDTFQEELPGLTVGMYADISIFTKYGNEKWHNVTTTGENIDVVIGIPKNLLQENRAYYIIRAHEGGYTLLSDIDEASDTITVSTDQFSSYAIVYRELGAVVDGGRTCGLCHICPTFLGSCCFLWLGFVASVCCIVALLIHRKVRSDIRLKRKQGRIGA